MGNSVVQPFVPACFGNPDFFFPMTVFRTNRDAAEYGLDLGVDKATMIDMFGNRVSLYSSECPGNQYVDQASLELTEIHFPLPPEC